MSDAGHDRELLLAQMAERDTVIVNLRRQVEEQTAELSKLRDEEAFTANCLQNK